TRSSSSAASVDGGFFNRCDYAQQVVKEIPYAKWRAHDPEDTMRFYSLRLREVGMNQVDARQDHRRGNRFAFLERPTRGTPHLALSGHGEPGVRMSAFGVKRT